jgi:hypothetical protein
MIIGKTYSFSSIFFKEQLCCKPDIFGRIHYVRYDMFLGHGLFKQVYPKEKMHWANLAGLVKQQEAVASNSEHQVFWILISRVTFLTK